MVRVVADWRDSIAESILGAAHEVYNVLGYGFVEKVYERALCGGVEAARGLNSLQAGGWSVGLVVNFGLLPPPQRMDSGARRERRQTRGDGLHGWRRIQGRQRQRPRDARARRTRHFRLECGEDAVGSYPGPDGRARRRDCQEQRGPRRRVGSGGGWHCRPQPSLRSLGTGDFGESANAYERLTSVARERTPRRKAEGFIAACKKDY